MIQTGKLEKVQNLDQKLGADDEYFRALVVSPAGQHETLLFTDSEIASARYRAKMNPEDEILPRWCDRLLFR